MTKVVFGLLFAITIIIMAGCSKADSQSNNTVQNNQMSTNLNAVLQYKDISPEAVKAYLKDDKNAILLDVRTVEEYTEKHIPGSILIPLDVIEKEASGILNNKDATIFVYCRSGNRSVAAAKALVGMGYTKVYNLGGIIDWPYETEAGAPKK